MILIATVVLSFFAAMGVGSFFFEFVFDFPGADPSLPLWAFVFLVALGVDYNIFLMARVREEAQRHGTRPGMLRGLAVTGGVITSAGIVLAGTFSVLASLPLVFLTEIGFMIAFGVLLDTFLVRSVLVPRWSSTSARGSGGHRRSRPRWSGACRRGRSPRRRSPSRWARHTRGLASSDQTQTPSAVMLRGLVKRFGPITAVDGLDLDVPYGKCVGLLGPNGAGKSTTMKALTAQVIADEGELEVLGFRLPDDSKQARAQMGVVPQLDNLDVSLTVERNLLVFAHLYRVPAGERKAAIERALDIANLGDRRDAKVDELAAACAADC